MVSRRLKSSYQHPASDTPSVECSLSRACAMRDKYRRDNLRLSSPPPPPHRPPSDSPAPPPPPHPPPPQPHASTRTVVVWDPDGNQRLASVTRLSRRVGWPVVAWRCQTDKRQSAGSKGETAQRSPGVRLSRGRAACPVTRPGVARGARCMTTRCRDLHHRSLTHYVTVRHRVEDEGLRRVGVRQEGRGW